MSADLIVCVQIRADRGDFGKGSIEEMQKETAKAAEQEKKK